MKPRKKRPKRPPEVTLGPESFQVQGVPYLRCGDCWGRYQRYMLANSQCPHCGAVPSEIIEL